MRYNNPTCAKQDQWVSSTEVSFEKNKAKVTYDPVLVTPEQLKAAIEAEGFTATDVRLTSKAVNQQDSTLSKASGAGAALSEG